MGKTAILAVRILGDSRGATDAMGATEAKAGGLMTRLGKIGAVAGVGLAAIGTAAVAAGRALYGIGETMDGVRDTIRVGTGASGTALDSLVTSAQSVASQVPAEFDKIATATADWNTRLGATGPILETLAAQALEAGRVLGTEIDINTASGAMTAFALSGNDATAAMDHLFRVAQSTGAGFNDLATDVAKNSPALQQLGFDFNSAVLLVGQLDKAGLDSTRMLSSMSSSLTKLARDGEAPRAAFERVVGEIDSYAAAGKDAAALDLAGKVFGTRNAAAFIAAIKSGTLSLGDMTSTAGLTSDTILGVAKETQDAAEKWQILTNRATIALEPLASLIFDGVGAALDWVINLIDSVDFSSFAGMADTAANQFAALGPVITDIGQLVARWLPTIYDTISEYLGLARDFINAAITGISAAWSAWGSDITAVITSAWSLISGVVRSAMTIIGGIIRTVTAVIRGDWSGAWDGIKQIVSGAWSLISGVVRSGVDVIRSAIRLALNIITSLWSRAWDGIRAAASGAWSAITRAASSGISSVTSFIRSLPNRIVNILSGLPSQMASVGRNMMTSLANALSPSAVIARIRSIMGDAISWAKRTLGIASPSKVFTAIGGFVGEGLALGISGSSARVSAASRDLARAAIPTRIYGPSTPTYYSPQGQSTAPAVVNITINGAIDPSSTARQIIDLLRRQARISGAIAINGIPTL